MSKLSKTAAASVKAAQTGKKEAPRVITIEAAVTTIKSLRAGNLHVGTELVDVLLAGYEAEVTRALDLQGRKEIAVIAYNELSAKYKVAIDQIAVLDRDIERLNEEAAGGLAEVNLGS